MFSFVKFFSGFNVFSGEKLAKLVFYGILIAIGIGIYHKVFIKDTQHTDIDTPNAQAVYKTDKVDNLGFGCVNYKVLQYDKAKN